MCNTVLTNDIQAANNKIFTNKSSNCSNMSSHRGLPARNQQKHVLYNCQPQVCKNYNGSSPNRKCNINHDDKMSTYAKTRDKI